MTDIEVLVNFGTPYVRLDDYNAMKERYWNQVEKTQEADDEAAKWKEHARTALARAEVAKARATEAATSSSANAAVILRVGDILDVPYAPDATIDDYLVAVLVAARTAVADISRLTARVADLEAAARWRPVTEKPPQPGMRYLTLSGGNYDIHAWNATDGWHGSTYGRAPLWWMPLPPPQEAQQ